VINPNYLANVLWFDPDPLSRTGPTDPNKTDAMSVCIHELGHALAYNGWMNGSTGELPQTYMSTFDRHVNFDGDDFWFEGANAMAVYGGPVPITFGNPFHLGNWAPRPGDDLIPELMNGVVFYNGQRYSISELDWAVLKDAGIAIVDPVCPADFNGDTSIDFFDYLDFVAAFSTGC
jgi:hypothetical protein